MESLPSRTRWWDWSAVLILIVTIILAATRLENTEWSTHLSIIPTLVFIGVLSGLALGQSRFPARLAFLFATAYGIYFISWELAAIGENLLSWEERLGLFRDRIFIVIDQLLKQTPVTDSIFFLLLMAVGFWVLSVTAGFTLTRTGNGWWTVLPTGLVIFAIHSFDPKPNRAYYLAVFIFFGLLLIARMVYLDRQSRWKESRTSLPPHLGIDFIRFTVIAVGVIVFAAWTVPALAKSVPVVANAAQPLRQSWKELRQNWQNAFASVRSTTGVTVEYYGNNLPLGQGAALTDAPVMFVKAPMNKPLGVRYYWRAAVYDTYLNGVWSNSIHQPVPFNPLDDPLVLPEEKERWLNEFEITPTSYAGTVFSPGQPYWVSTPSTALQIKNPDGTIDVSGFRTTRPIRPQETYQVQASLTQASEADLRKAGIDYPSWVAARYLALPENLTPRTRQLAEEITTDIDNPYDQAVAITNFLRDNIVYQETVPEIPRNVEPIDWFLFRHKQGFCNYYASAAILMLRSKGIPARLAVGYAQGEKFPEDVRYHVLQRESHAWPEVYFPGYGWVEFEPTSSQPAIARMSGGPAISTGPEGLTVEEELAELRRSQREEMLRQNFSLPEPSPENSRPFWLNILTGMLIILLVGGLGYLIWRISKRVGLPSFPNMLENAMIRLGIQPPKALRAWSLRAALPPLSKSYTEINRALGRLGNTPGSNLTPYERAEKLGEILPPTAIPAQNLVTEYQLETFASVSADTQVARQAGREIYNLSLKASMQRLLENIFRFSRKN
jgi:transglutaminase-like putative cysteine protease